MTTRETHRLTCDGNTRQWRKILADRRWTWDAARQVWYVGLVDAHAERIVAGDAEFLKGLGGQLKGCRLCLDGREVWRSKTYGETQTAASRDPDGYGWNCDAAGNAVAGGRIPGSDPVDQI